ESPLEIDRLQPLERAAFVLHRDIAESQSTLHPVGPMHDHIFSIRRERSEVRPGPLDVSDLLTRVDVPLVQYPLSVENAEPLAVRRETHGSNAAVMAGELA